MGCGTPGLRQAGQLGDNAVADVSQIRHSLGHQATDLGEQVDELRDGLDRGPNRRASLGDSLLGRRQPRPVLRQPRGRRQHLRRRAGGVFGALAQPVGHRGGGRGEPGGLRRTLRLVDVGQRVDAVHHRHPARPDHRRIADPGDDRDATEDGHVNQATKNVLI